LSRCSKYQDLIKRQSTMIRDVSVDGLASMLPAMQDEDGSEGQFMEA